MKSICKVLALCLCFGLVISMCACKGGGGGGGGSSSSSSNVWTTGTLVAQYVGNRQKHVISFMSDGVVALFDTETNVIDRPYKTWKWDTTKKTFTPEGGTEINVETATTFKYKCDHAEVTYTKQ